MNYRNNRFIKFISNNLSAFISLLITSFTFCLGWAYLYHYFNLFGIDVKSLHLPLIYYFQNIVFPVAIILIVFLFIFLAFRFLELSMEKKWSINIPNKKLFFYILKKLVVRNTLGILIARLVFVTIGISLLRLIFELPNKYVITMIITVIVISAITYSAKTIHNKISYINVVIEFGKEEIEILALTVGICLFLLIYMGIEDIAKFDAMNMIKNSSNNNALANFELKSSYDEEKIRKDIERRQLFFVAYTNDSYYLVEKNKVFNPEKDTPNIYIIPKEEIKYINLRKIKP